MSPLLVRLIQAVAWILIGILFIFSVTVLWLAFAYMAGEPRGLAYSLAALAAAVSNICCILFFTHITDVIRLASPYVKAIWITLIVGLLSMSVGVAKSFFDGPPRLMSMSPPTADIKVGRLALIDKTKGQDGRDMYLPRLDPRYLGARAEIAFMLTINDFQIGVDGKPNLRVSVVLENTDARGKAEFGTQETRETRADWVQRHTPAQCVQVENICGDWLDSYPIVYTLANRLDLGAGEFKLVIIVEDLLTGHAAVASKTLTIQPGAP